MLQSILPKILSIPAILIGFTFHEFAHAYVADKLGDKTPKFQGRLTFNPMAHIDPLGFLMILLIGIGWAKPVETNPSAFRHYYKDDLKVSIAGPIANLIVAFVFAGIFVFYQKFIVLATINSTLFVIVYKILNYVVWINCALAIFNLIPLPGLDGFHVLRDLAPSKFYKISDVLYRYQFIILIVFIFFLSDFIIFKPASIIYSLFINFFSLF